MKTSKILIGYLLLTLVLQACNLELVESPADADIVLTITANAALIETALASGVQPPADLAQPNAVEPASAGNEAPPSTEEVVIPAAVLPPAVGDVTVTVSVATNCRLGPGAAFASVYGMPVGQVAKVIAKNESSGYWIIEIPGQNGQTCWLWGQYATVTGNTSSLKVVVTPTTAATKTTTATKIGAPTATFTPIPEAIAGCTTNDPNAGPRGGLDSCYDLSESFSVPGCMDPIASNYDSKATVDSGICTYTKPKAPTLGVSFVNCTPAANGETNYAVTLAWSDNSNNETGFNIVTNLSLRGANANSTSYSFTETYPAGTVLNVSLTAYNNVGQSRSATTSFTCAAPTKPNAPIVDSVACTVTTLGDGSYSYEYRISWIDTSDNEDGFRISGPDGGETNYPENSTFHTGIFIGPPPPSVQKVTVYAYNAQGESVGSKKFNCP